ncbi:hypothetical protein PR048_007409 [Dryococelus australis]|uniref:Uncharacterized protein n=1 Tax=Dryococelus australis TaxID=614101 RepID=A0ABQ9HU57_9NEOP|nr:hypothetical protein PR048_007409 [Dryococelus australis]
MSETLENVPACNVFSYGETNITDYPGKKLLLYRRGVKDPEKVMNHSKSSTTIMICASASVNVYWIPGQRMDLKVTHTLKVHAVQRMHDSIELLMGGWRLSAFLTGFQLFFYHMLNDWKANIIYPLCVFPRIRQNYVNRLMSPFSAL